MRTRKWWHRNRSALLIAQRVKRYLHRDEINRARRRDAKRKRSDLTPAQLTALTARASRARYTVVAYRGAVVV